MIQLSDAQLRGALNFLNDRKHGDGARPLESALNLAAGEILDLSASMNPAADDYRETLMCHLGSLRHYPDEGRARDELAEKLNVDPSVLILCNGASEAISLVSNVVSSGRIMGPEFSLYSRYIQNYDASGPLWASNPNNPTGLLLANELIPEVVDEAFYQMATGSWSRRDFEKGSFVIGSLTKLFSLPGLRMGYIVAPSRRYAELLHRIRPEWSLNSLASSVIPSLVHDVDLQSVCERIASFRSQLVALLDEHGYKSNESVANYVFIAESRDLFTLLLKNKILVRDTSSFGLPGGVRVAVPNERGLDRLQAALNTPQTRFRKRPGGALMVVGTTSDSGKSTIVAALCRVLSNNGIAVAPFKAQNMSLNSAVTSDGYEIGRAQARQAVAARTEASVHMNPILLKPTSQSRSQVIVLGEPLFEMGAREYQSQKSQLLDVVIDSFRSLENKYEAVILEGAGSPAEINLLDNDIVNLSLAQKVNANALLVGDIDRGGVFASLYGTVKILPDHLSNCIIGTVINKIRGDVSLLDTGIERLERLIDKKCFGVIPFIDLPFIDSEDSMALASYGSARRKDSDHVDVAIIDLPRISNFTDFDPLVFEDGCSVRIVKDRSQLGSPDLVIIPGSKTTIDDLHWMRACGFELELKRLRDEGSVILGICAGYQMLGETIEDGIESSCSHEAGFGYLPVDTVFRNSKVTLMRNGTSDFFDGVSLSGYQIHHGRVISDPDCSLFRLDAPSRDIEGVALYDGATDQGNRVFGTSLHGIFENDSFRNEFLGFVAKARNKAFKSALRFEELRDSQIELIADLISRNVDLKGLFSSSSIVFK